MNERCEKCGKISHDCKSNWRENQDPIFYNKEYNFNKPVSELIEDIRCELSKVRGKLWDIKTIRGFEHEIEFAEGSLTCIIVALYNSMNNILKYEKDHPK